MWDCISGNPNQLWYLDASGLKTYRTTSVPTTTTTCCLYAYLPRRSESRVEAHESRRAEDEL